MNWGAARSVHTSPKGRESVNSAYIRILPKSMAMGVLNRKKKCFVTPELERGPLTLIKTEYWDRAGGGGNISYDW